MKLNLKSNILLFLAAIIWGAAFVFQEKAAQYLDNFAINAFRCLIGFVFLLIIVIIKAKVNKEKIITEKKEDLKLTIIASILCGVFLFFAMNLQQFGISVYPEGVASAGRTSFLTGIYAIHVAIINVILYKKFNINVIISAVLVLLGVYFLCFGQGFEHLYIGDLINFISSLCFALHIIVVDKYINKIDGLKLATYQLLVAGILSLILMFIIEKPTIENILKAIVPLLFLGVGACAVADSFQIYGQKFATNSTVGAIIMSLEIVFAAIFGVLILKESLDTKEIIGCILMFSAIVLAQLPGIVKKKKLQKEI